MTESQIRMANVYSKIQEKEKENLVNFYGVNLCKYENIEGYLEELPNVYEKICLSQRCYNKNVTNSLIKSVVLTDYEKKKYNSLLSKNIDLNDNIDIRILNEKYSFLDDILDMIVTDMDIQEQILSLSDARLKLFQMLYEGIKRTTDYYPPYIVSVLNHIGYVSIGGGVYKNQYHCYDDLLENIEINLKNGGTLSDKDINVLLYIFNSSIKYEMVSLSELKKYGDNNTFDQMKFELDVQNLIETNDGTDKLKTLKQMLLGEIYGLSLRKAKEILTRYDLSNITKTAENQDLFDMYKAISLIVNEENFDKLVEFYHLFSKQFVSLPDFRRITVFENEIRKMYSRDLNAQVFKTNDKSSVKFDDVDVYDAGVDFKMVVTAIGAYQNSFGSQENYSSYWNSPTITSHGNCCSLIGNSNLSTANVKNVILGFSTMNDNMLLLCGNKDINSSPDSIKFLSLDNRSQKFMNADALLDSTRGDYNELVYERRDLSSNPTYYKKNPDYVVYIDEYIDFDKTLEYYKSRGAENNVQYMLKQKEDLDYKWNESVKAAKDFGVPIVKINREKVAISELDAIMGMVEYFENTKDASLLDKIISRFESNRVGNSGMHNCMLKKYFSPNKMASILDRIKNTIDLEDDIKNKCELYKALYDAIDNEKNKVRICAASRNRNQQSSIDLNAELKSLSDTISMLSMEIDKQIGRKL